MTRVFLFPDYIAYLEDAIKFENSYKPIIKEFGDYLARKGFDENDVKYFTECSYKFIGYVCLISESRKLEQLTKAQVSSKYIRFLNKGIPPLKNRMGKIISYQFEHSKQLKAFFIFLHLHKNCTNVVVLRAFCDKEELKQLGIK